MDFLTNLFSNLQTTVKHHDIVSFCEAVRAENRLDDAGLTRHEIRQGMILFLQNSDIRTLYTQTKEV